MQTSAFQCLAIWLTDQSYTWSNAHFALTCRLFSNSIAQPCYNENLISMNNFDFLRLLHCPFRNVCLIAAKNGNLNLLKKARDHNAPWNEKVCEVAALSGNLEMLKWAHENGCPWDQWTFSAAATRGCLDQLDYLFEHGCFSKCPYPTYTILWQLAEHGHLVGLQWALRKGIPWDQATYAKAAYSGHFHIIQWAYSHGYEWDADLCTEAASGGHLDILKWARERGAPWSWITSLNAAWLGNLEILQWAIDNGCPLHEGVASALAEKGNLSMFKWLIEHNCPWDRDECLKLSMKRRSYKTFDEGCFVRDYIRSISVGNGYSSESTSDDEF